MPDKTSHRSLKISPKAIRRLIIIVEIIALLGAIAVFIATAAPHQTIRCERDAEGVVACRVTRTFFKLIEYDTLEIPGALFANLGEDCAPSGCTYALQLFSADQGFIEIEPYRQYDKFQATLMDIFNDFMQDEEAPSVEMAYRLNPVNYLTSAVIVGLLIALLGVTLWGQRQRA